MTKVNKQDTREIEGIMLNGISFEDGTFLVFAHERIRLLKHLKIKYSVSYEEVELPKDRWKVKAILTIMDVIPMVYENFAIREGYFGLETAATIALSRAIAVAGYGAEFGVSTSEGYQQMLALKPKDSVTTFFEKKEEYKKIETKEEQPKKETVKTEKKIKKQIPKAIKDAVKAKEDFDKLGIEEETPQEKNRRAIHKMVLPELKEYLTSNNVPYTKIIPTPSVKNLKELSFHVVEGDLIEYVTQTYGELKATFVGGKFKEEVKSTFAPKKDTFTPTKNKEEGVSLKTPRNGMQLADLLKRFDKQKINDGILKNSLKNAGIEGFDTVKEFLIDGDKNIVDLVIKNFNL